MFKTDTGCTLVPYFEVQADQLPAFKELAKRFVALTRKEPGCVHYAFSFNGTTAHCREGYDNAAALLAHLDNVQAPFNEALKIARVMRLEVHGPAGEIDKLRAPLAALKPEFYVLEEDGIRRE